jgi:alkane 1-monooxygenase
MILFALASLSPVASLAAACLLGGVWPLVALLHMTLLVALLDRLPVAATTPRLDADRAAHALNLTLGLLHFPVLALGVLCLARGTPGDAWQTGATALALGLWLGQVSVPNAHELIHAPGRGARRLGAAVFTSLLFGHHASAHPKVHHAYVASDADPNSARLGEGFYRFWPRAWVGSFLAGWQAETAIRGERGRRAYAGYVGGALITLLLAAALAGSLGLFVLVGLALYAQTQLLLADYIQHYGLRRKRDAEGGLEPVGPQHSWNAPHWYSSAMMLNAPRHSDHHQHPARRFPALDLSSASMPIWPRPMPAMAALALLPPLWRRVMDPRAARWRGETVAPAPPICQGIDHADDLPDSPLPDRGAGAGASRPLGGSV